MLNLQGISQDQFRRFNKRAKEANKKAGEKGHALYHVSPDDGPADDFKYSHEREAPVNEGASIESQTIAELKSRDLRRIIEPKNIDIPWYQKRGVLIAMGCFILGALLLGRYIFFSNIQKSDFGTKEINDISLNAALPIGVPTAAQSIMDGQIVLEVFARDDVWVKTNVDEDLLYEGVLLRGMTERWQADDSILIKVADPEKVWIRRNGKRIHLKISPQKRPSELRFDHDGYVSLNR